MSVAPLNAFLGMDWMKFSLRSLWRQKAKHCLHTCYPKGCTSLVCFGSVGHVNHAALSWKQHQRVSTISSFQFNLAFQPAAFPLHSLSLPLLPHSSVQNGKLRAIFFSLPDVCQHPEVWCCMGKATHNGAVIFLELTLFSVHSCCNLSRPCSGVRRPARCPHTDETNRQQGSDQWVVLCDPVEWIH